MFRITRRRRDIASPNRVLEAYSEQGRRRGPQGVIDWKERPGTRDDPFCYGSHTGEIKQGGKGKQQGIATEGRGGYLIRNQGTGWPIC